MGCENERLRDARASRGKGSRGSSSVFLPKLFLGSEGEVASLLTKPCRGASRGALRLCFSQILFGSLRSGLRPDPAGRPSSRRLRCNHRYVGGSECALPSVNALVARREMQVQLLFEPATARWRNSCRSRLWRASRGPADSAFGGPISAALRLLRFPSRAVRARLLLVMHASAMVRIHHPRSVFSLVFLLWVVSGQLLRTGASRGQDVR
jgi:hypothetical protein